MRFIFAWKTTKSTLPISARPERSFTHAVYGNEGTGHMHMENLTGGESSKICDHYAPHRFHESSAPGSDPPE